MEDMRQTANTANCVAQEHQAYMAPFRENMQGGRSAKEIHPKPYSQMMVASNAYSRTAIDQKVTIEPSKKTSIIQIKENTEDLNSMKANEIILKVACEIENENFHGDNQLSPCLFVTKKLDFLTRRFGSKHNKYRPFIIQNIGPYYLKYLIPALSFFKYKFAAGCSWEHFRELNLIAKYFVFHPTCTPYIEHNRKAIKALYKEAINTELNHIAYSTNDPVLKNIKYILTVFKHISSRYSTAYINNFITIKNVKEYEEYLEKQNNIVSHSINKKTNHKITEQLDYLDSKQSPERPISSADRRMYYCLLNEKLSILSKDSQPGHKIDFHSRAYMLQNLTNMCCKYHSIINNIPCLINEITTIARAVSLETLLTIEEKRNLGVCQEEALNYIFILGKKNYLNEECEHLYKRCRHPQTVMKTSSFTVHQCKERFDEIHQILKTKSPEKFLTSARMLKELLDEKKEAIMQIITIASLCKQLKTIKSLLYMGLFSKTFHAYNECKQNDMDIYQTTQTMSIYQGQFIQSNPYTFALRCDNFRDDWCKIGCFVLYNKISELPNKTKIYEEDTEALLLLKDLNEKLPHHFIRGPVENALLKCLHSIRDNADLISIKTVNALYSWVDILDKTFSINSNLSSLDGQWKSAIPTQTSDFPPFAQPTSGNQVSIPPIPMMMPHLATQHPVQASYQPPKTQQHPLLQPTTMHHAEDRQENPLSLAIQQIRLSPLEPSMRLELLESAEYDDTPMPIRNIHLQSHPEYPYLPSPLSTHFPNILPPSPLYQNISRQQASYQQQVALCRAMPHQYHPMDSPNFSER